MTETGEDKLKQVLGSWRDWFNTEVRSPGEFVSGASIDTRTSVDAKAGVAGFGVDVKDVTELDSVTRAQKLSDERIERPASPGTAVLNRTAPSAGYAYKPEESLFDDDGNLIR